MKIIKNFYHTFKTQLKWTDSSTLFIMASCKSGLNIHHAKYRGNQDSKVNLAVSPLNQRKEKDSRPQQLRSRPAVLILLTGKKLPPSSLLRKLFLRVCTPSLLDKPADNLKMKLCCTGCYLCHCGTLGSEVCCSGWRGAFQGTHP